MTVHLNKKLVDEILKSPQAPVVLQEVQLALDEEKQRRETFYNDISEQEKVEFINGEVIIHSPVANRHGKAVRNLSSLIHNYVAIKKLGYTGIEKILIRLTRNDYEPDICFFKLEKSREFKEDQCLFPTPDFIVEVLSKGTEKRDRGIKFKDYEAHGVKEYWMINAEKQTVEQCILENNIYRSAIKTNLDTISSIALLGFEIPVKAIFDDIVNVETLMKLLAKR